MIYFFNIFKEILIEVTFDYFGQNKELKGSNMKKYAFFSFPYFSSLKSANQAQNQNFQKSCCKFLDTSAKRDWSKFKLKRQH